MPFGQRTVTQEPSRIMAALQSVLPMQRTGRPDAEAGDAMQASPMQEAGAACHTFRSALPRTAEAEVLDRYQKQLWVAR